MKLSSLIASLQDFLDSGGDCDVMVSILGGYDDHEGFVCKVERDDEHTIIYGTP